MVKKEHKRNRKREKNELDGVQNVPKYDSSLKELFPCTCALNKDTKEVKSGSVLMFREQGFD